MPTLQDNQQVKKCSKCRKQYPVTDFSKSLAYSDGFASNCKHCKRKKYHERMKEKNKYADLYGF